MTLTRACYGIEATPVSSWLAETLPEARPPFLFEKVGQGKSNLTHRVTDTDGGAWILRRKVLAFWYALSAWKIAIILEGVRRRALDQPSFGRPLAPAIIDALARRAEAIATRSGF
jgi:aminoglycoside phosphotransferase (APT) family kinase protein